MASFLIYIERAATEESGSAPLGALRRARVVVPRPHWRDAGIAVRRET